MGIKKLTILGKSDAVITMITDNLESDNDFPVIEIINNLNLPIEHSFINSKFITLLKPELESYQDCFLGVNKSYNKKKVFDVFNININNFINIIHKTSSISKTTTLGKGCLINSLVSVAAHTKVGNFVSLNRNSSVGHHTIIENYVTIQPGANVCGFVSIGEGTLIGAGANVIDGIKIGKNSIIGAGSVVTKDIPDNVIAYGNPCKIIRKNEA
jgi:sugar O-acyltransferase (sialic acid O-acetyltransferase NeuD family)